MVVKAKKVIESCKTYKHLQVCTKYVFLCCLELESQNEYTVIDETFYHWEATKVLRYMLDTKYEELGYSLYR